LKDCIMSKLNAIVIATTLLFAAAAQAESSAAVEASQAQTAQAMRFEGVDHLIPAQRSEEARSASAKPVAKPAPAAAAKKEPQAQQAERKPAEIKAGLSRAEVVAELQRARANGEMDRIHAELGYVPAPVGRTAIEARDTRVATLR
jgi:hypothetical protein